MRIISGRLKGRIFDAPRGRRTHPMSEKVRGALFNALGDIEGLSVLDAYAGSGALSFEAISRGAAKVTAIDNSKDATDIISSNSQKLGIESRVQVIRTNIAGWMRTATNLQFNVVLADPPYGAVNPQHINKLASKLKNDGVLVLSLPPNERTDDLLPNMKLVNCKSHGDASLYFYVHKHKK